jgi:hypothetical protein
MTILEQDLFYSAYILSVFSNTDKTINPDDDSGLSVLSAIAAATGPVPVDCQMNVPPAHSAGGDGRGAF